MSANKDDPKKMPASPQKSTENPPTSDKLPVPAAPKPAAGAPPPKKEPEAPPFEKGLVEEIKKKFGESIKVVFIKPLRIKIQVEPRAIVEVATFLGDSMGFDHGESAGGTDYPKENQIELTYDLGGYTREDLTSHNMSL